MKCPYCGHNDTKVTDSREADDGIRRRRECLKCSQRFTTYERVQAAPIMVVKKDGRREEFDREKVLTGIRRSCAKLPVSGRDIEAIVDDIETTLHAAGVMEVPSTEVGDMVMERLRELSHVAYVRFASHYRNFLSFEELQEEFERLNQAPRRSARRAGAAQPPLLPEASPTGAVVHTPAFRHIPGASPREERVGTWNTEQGTRNTDQNRRGAHLTSGPCSMFLVPCSRVEWWGGDCR